MHSNSSLQSPVYQRLSDHEPHVKSVLLIAASVSLCQIFLCPSSFLFWILFVIFFSYILLTWVCQTYPFCNIFLIHPFNMSVPNLFSFFLQLLFYIILQISKSSFSWILIHSLLAYKLKYLSNALCCMKKKKKK